MEGRKNKRERKRKGKNEWCGSWVDRNAVSSLETEKGKAKQSLLEKKESRQERGPGWGLD
jgi:hypothetical protein